MTYVPGYETFSPNNCCYFVQSGNWERQKNTYVNFCTIFHNAQLGYKISIRDKARQEKMKIAAPL